MKRCPSRPCISPHPRRNPPRTSYCTGEVDRLALATRSGRGVLFSYLHPTHGIDGFSHHLRPPSLPNRGQPLLLSMLVLLPQACHLHPVPPALLGDECIGKDWRPRRRGKRGRTWVQTELPSHNSADFNKAPARRGDIMFPSTRLLSTPVRKYGNVSRASIECERIYGPEYLVTL